MSLLDERFVVSERAVDQDHWTSGLCHGGGEQAHAESSASEVHVQLRDWGVDIPGSLGLRGGADQVCALTPSKQSRNTNIDPNRTQTINILLDH